MRPLLLALMVTSVYAQNPTPLQPPQNPRTAWVTLQSDPVYIASGKENFLMGEIPDPTPEWPGVATHCAGFLHTGDHSNTPYEIPTNAFPVQATQPKCKINITGHLKPGVMTWYACSYDWNNPMGGGTAPQGNCNGVPLRFNVIQQ